VQTSDGGYIAAGVTPGYGGTGDVWVLKLDEDGDLLWDRRYGGLRWDEAHSIRETSDGGSIVAGETESRGEGESDAWVLKLDQDGGLVWDRTLGGPGQDEAVSILQTSDGGYVGAGTMRLPPTQNADVWVFRLDAGGNLLWHRTFGGAGDDIGYEIQQTSDRGFVVAATRQHFDAPGAYVLWILKLDSRGFLQWDRDFEWLWNNEARSVQQTTDGGFVAVGMISDERDSDAVILKLDSSGNLEWQRRLEDPERTDWPLSLALTPDRGFVFAGPRFKRTDSVTGTGVVRFSASGSLLWDRTIQCGESCEAESIRATADGGFVLAGATAGSASIFDVDAMVLKLNAEGQGPF